MSDHSFITAMGGVAAGADTHATLAANPSRLAVCHVLSGDAWAGAEVQAAGLIRALYRRPDLRLAAIVLNEGRLADELRETGIAVCVIPESRNNFFSIVAAAESFVRLHGPAVLHSHRYKENLLALLLARRCGVAVNVRTQHGLPEPFRGARAVRHSATQWLDRFCGRHWSDAVFCVSNEMMPELQRIYGSRTVLARNGIDAARVHSTLSREEAKRKFGLPEDAPVVGLVGRLEPVKRGDLFLEAAVELRRSSPAAHFVLTGTGSMEPELKRYAVELGLTERVHFLGHRDDVYDVLRALEVLMMTSDHEGLPMVLLEALRLGVPVAARSVGGIREVLGREDCGLTVASACAKELAAACRRLIEDTTLRERLRLRGIRRIEEDFSVERTADEVANCYRDLASMKKGERS